MSNIVTLRESLSTSKLSYRNTCSFHLNVISKIFTGYANNEEDVAKDLYEALQQFFKLFPNLRKNDFYVTGESYAGKYFWQI